MHLRRSIGCWLLAAGALTGCPDPTPPPIEDAGAAADAGAPVDAGPDRSAICAELGLPVRPLDPEATGAAFESVAGDFEVETLDGSFSLFDRWSGCESFVVLAYSASAYGQALFSSGPDGIFAPGSPRNVHYLFASHEPETEAIRARMTELRDYLEETYGFYELPVNERAHWRQHVHFVVTPLGAAGGSLGELVRSQPGPPNALAVTRQQRWDPVGSLFRVGAGGFTPRLEMVRYVAPYFDYLHDLDARLESEEATVVPVLTAERTTDRTIDRTVTLPDLSPFGTLEVDVELTCLLSPDGCSEWDRIAAVYVCDDEACAEPREFVRWITPYSRPGRRRWAIDASPLMGLLSAGPQTLRMSFGPDWEEATERVVSVSLRFREASGPVAQGAALAFRGGAFNAGYNGAHAPFRFTPDAETTRTELVVVVSGHGQEAGNCAEWCNHRHHFTVGGSTHTIEFDGQAGQATGCAERTGDGVPPGQWGNWAPLRAGWCPGLPLEPHRFDLTDALTPGVEQEIVYEADYDGAEPPGGQIQLSAYVVSYR